MDDNSDTKEAGTEKGRIMYKYNSLSVSAEVFVTLPEGEVISDWCVWRDGLIVTAESGHCYRVDSSGSVAKIEPSLGGDAQ